MDVSGSCDYIQKSEIQIQICKLSLQFLWRTNLLKIGVVRFNITVRCGKKSTV